MANPNIYPDITAVITGASSGIGAAFAELLAQQGMNCLLVGRRKEKLASLAAELQRKFPNTHCEVHIADLSSIEETNQLAQMIANMPSLTVLINNAGYNVDGRFGDVALQEHLDLCQVHMGATVTLTHSALPNLLNNAGKLINVASLASYLPTPMATLYGPTKSFLRYFTSSIAASYKQHGLQCIAVCPGFVRTDFHEKLGLRPDEFYKDSGLIKAHSAQSVAQQALKDLEKGRIISVKGANYRLMRMFVRLLPEQLLYKLLSKTKLARPDSPKR